MKQIKIFIVAILFAAGVFTSPLSANPGSNFDSYATAIITKVLKSQPADSSLRKIYQVSGNHPIWVTQNGFTSLGKQLLRRVGSDPMVDHNTKFYNNYKKLSKHRSSAFGGKSSMSRQVSLEFKMSKLYRDYANYTIYGLIHWGHFKILFKRQAGLHDVYADWEIYPQYTTYSLLRTIIANGHLDSYFDAVTPHTKLYTSLQKKLYEYSKIASRGGWPAIPSFDKLEPGNSYKVIPLIRKRLYLSGDLIGCPAGSSLVYDSCLVDAVKRFQKRHGLRADGVIGSGTAAFLRQSIREVMIKMQLNLDRMKMMKRHDSGRYIMINIPAFRLYFIENGKVRQTMKVITGSKKHPTPIFSNSVKTIVLNPYWNVPTSIIQKEMIPKLLRNPNAMRKQNIEIRNGWGPDAKKISASSVNWSKYRYSKAVPYRFAQLPGNGNALGRVKFLFPNKFSVYMHDTPTKHLFNRNVRAYSHGCIRLEKPKELLKTFSTFNSNVDYEKAQNILKTKKQTFHELDEQVPVDVTYLTAWVDPDGILQIRNDIYGYDRMQLKYRRRY